MRATCSEFGGFIRLGVKQFGTEEACVGVSAYAQAVGCSCVGGSQFQECLVCEFGLENPDHFMAEIGTTCAAAREYVLQDVYNFESESTCNDARLNMTLSGCVCKDGLQEDALVADSEALGCVVCNHGLSNPNLFVDAIQAQCGDAALFIEKNSSAPGECEENRLGLLELGCSCKQDESTANVTANSLGV